jgi:hypothetical protein
MAISDHFSNDLIASLNGGIAFVPYLRVQIWQPFFQSLTHGAQKILRIRKPVRQLTGQRLHALDDSAALQVFWTAYRAQWPWQRVTSGVNKLEHKHSS